MNLCLSNLKFQYKYILFSLFLLVNLNSVAQSQNFTVASVGEANVAKDSIAIATTLMSRSMSAVQKNIGEKLISLIGDDFNYYKAKYSVKKLSDSKLTYQKRNNFRALQSRGIDVLVQTKFISERSKIFILVKVLHALRKEVVYTAKVSFSLGNWRGIAHSIADKIYQKLNDGKRSIFKDRIVFVSNFGSTQGNVYKELYIVDFDGERKKRLTYHRGIVISPAVSPDGNKIIYSLIESNAKKKNINLMMLNLVTGKTSLVSGKKGINSGAVFTYDGKSILLTLSFNGNADIYEMRLDNKQLVQITDHRAADVDPSINASGAQMSFLSDRSGRAMIYSLDLKRPGAKPVRISYVGKFNATPRFSPSGDDIVFSSWLDRGFDIFRIKSTGNSLVRLTKQFGSNEEPSFSFDNEFIVFTSRRVISSKSVRDSIYLMTRDGEILKEVVKGFGQCTTPRWLR